MYHSGSKRQAEKDEAEGGTSGDGNKEKFLASVRQKPPVNLWMLIHSCSASWICKRVNAAEAWACERRHIVQRTTTTRPAFHTQHWRWWWISHMYIRLLYHKRTHTALAVSIRIFCITLVKNIHSHTHLKWKQNKKHAFIHMHRLCTHLHKYTQNTFINVNPVC